MGNLSGLFGSSYDAYSIVLDPFFFFGLLGKNNFVFCFPNLRRVGVFCFVFRNFLWKLRMRINVGSSQLQMCLWFCDPSAIVSAAAVTVGLVW